MEQTQFFSTWCRRRFQIRGYRSERGTSTSYCDSSLLLKQIVTKKHATSTSIVLSHKSSLTLLQCIAGQEELKSELLVPDLQLGGSCICACSAPRFKRRDVFVMPQRKLEQLSGPGKGRAKGGPKYRDIVGVSVDVLGSFCLTPPRE